VILCGALRLTATLPLSGVGPADELKQHGIGVVHELPGIGETCRIIWIT
jgi:choline dehydrogenase